MQVLYGLLTWSVVHLGQKPHRVLSVNKGNFSRYFAQWHLPLFYYVAEWLLAKGVSDSHRRLPCWMFFHAVISVCLGGL